MNICLNVRLEALHQPDSSTKTSIEGLIELCKEADGFDPHLRFDTHLNACKKIRPWLLAWLYPPDTKNGNGKNSSKNVSYRILAGAASAFAPTCREGEIRACVAPVFRRQGVFTLLYRGLEARLRSAGAESVLLVCEKASPSGVTIASRLGAVYEHGELLMRLNKSALDKLEASKRVPNGVRLVPVTESMLGKSAAVFSAIFESNFSESKTFGEAIFYDKNQEQFLVMSKEGLVGYMAIASGSDGVALHSMGVLPEFRRQGFGKEILNISLSVLKKRNVNKISLEVNAENMPAIALYQKAGFEEQSRAEYWKLGSRQITKLQH
ncbi:GNAT family N-acetyltransferase [Spirochaetota bacterium]